MKMTFFRKHLFAALFAVSVYGPAVGTALAPREAQSSTTIPDYCLQLDGSGSVPNFLDLFGEDSRQWTHEQRVIFYDCLGMDYEVAAARYAAFGLDIDRAVLQVRSGPGSSEVLDAIYAEFDAAIGSVGGTPFYSSPWVSPVSVLENHRHEPLWSRLWLSWIPKNPRPRAPSPSRTKMVTRAWAG